MNLFHSKHKKLLSRVAGVICLSYLPLHSYAEAWTGEGSAGLILTSGNSDTEVLNVGLKLGKKQENLEHTFLLAANTAEDSGEKSAESYLGAYNLKYNLNDKNFVFGEARYLDDKFDSFEGISTIGAGYGYRIINTEDHSWVLSAGLGYRTTELETTGEDISGTAFIGESDYKIKLSNTTEFFDTFRIESTSDNSYIQNIAGLTVAMSDALSLKLSYDVRHNTDVTAGSNQTDSITAVSVVYKL